MSLKNIVLHADASPGFKSRACVAANLVSSTDCFLSVVHNRPRGSTLRAEFAAPGMLLDNYEELMWGYERRSREMLHDECEPRDVVFEWVRDDGHPVDALTRQSRLADAVILGRTKKGSAKSGATVETSDVILASGRPCLIVPDEIDSAWRPENVAIAWNDSIESAKAVRETVPWLTSAKQVHVVCVSDEDTETSEVEAYLQRYGVEPVVHAFGVVKAQSESGAIADWCESERIDLLIQGAYGHRRRYEAVFGGVTDFMIKHATFPVLMVH